MPIFLGEQINLLVPYASAQEGHLRIFSQVANCSVGRGILCWSGLSRHYDYCIV